MKFILGEKQEMTQKHAPNGAVIPVTKITVAPCVVTQVKRDASDGYLAVQIATGKKRNLPKPLKGHFKDLGSFRFVREFRLATADAAQTDSLKVGDKISVETFQPGDKVKVTGTSKGRGIQGVVKRHGFHGSPKTHGNNDQLRTPGSSGATEPQHVFKGSRMGGQMGNAQVTVANLEVIAIDSQKGELFIKGAVPGARGNLIMIYGGGDIQVVAVPSSKEENKKDTAEEVVAAVVAGKKEPEGSEPAAPVEDKTENKIEDKQETTT